MPEHLTQSIVYVPSNEQLHCPLCYLERWKRVKILNHLSRRRLILEIEQSFARTSHIEFRFIESNHIYQPAFCWEDLDGRWVSQYLEGDTSGEKPKRFCTRRIERQIQIDLFLQETMAQYEPLVSRLREAHGHPGCREPQVANVNSLFPGR